VTFGHFAPKNLWSLTPSENELGPGITTGSGMGISGQIWHIYGKVRDFLEAD
jgi:hypothetical protein